MRGSGKDYKDHSNIFAGIGCAIDNPKAYYLRILVDVFAWYFRFSKVKSESRYYKTYYGTELGVAFFHSRKYSINWLELNFNLLSWLLYFPYVFIITCPDIIIRLINLFFAAIINSSIFMCNFSLLEKHLEIHAVNIMQILCLFIPRNDDNYNYIRVVKETVCNRENNSRKTTTQTHYKFGGTIKRNLPITYIHEEREGGEKSDIKAEVIITILNILLPCISIII